MKKVISMMVVFGLVTSQIGCAGKAKVTKISAPLDHVKFEKKYKYLVKLKTGEKTQAVTGDQIEINKNELSIKTKNGKKTLLTQDIQEINGMSYGFNSKGAFKGLGIGFGVGAALGALIGGMATLDNCEDGDTGCTIDKYTPALVGAGIFGSIGGLIGFGAGASKAGKEKIQITPVVTPTSSGVDAGVNVGMKF